MRTNVHIYLYMYELRTYVYMYLFIHLSTRAYMYISPVPLLHHVYFTPPFPVSCMDHLTEIDIVAVG